MPDVLPISDRVAKSRYRGGDIIAFYGQDWRSRIIEAVTAGPSHVGIVCEWPMPATHGGYDIELVLIEATTMCPRPCLLQEVEMNGVQAQRPRDRVADYDGHAQLYRLADHWTLSEDENDDLTELLAGFIGKPYDYRGALWSGTRILKYLPRMPYSDLGTLFCSELIATCVQRLGRLCVTNAGFFNPASLVHALVKSGVYLPGVPL